MGGAPPPHPAPCLHAWQQADANKTTGPGILDGFAMNELQSSAGDGANFPLKLMPGQTGGIKKNHTTSCQLLLLKS
jgi:hypothetical protein